MELPALRAKAAQIRMDLLKMIHGAKTGHTGGSLSNTDILTALYYRVMKIDPRRPKWEERDRFGYRKTAAFVTVSAGLLVWFYPVLVGITISRWWVDVFIRWLPSWGF